TGELCSKSFDPFYTTDFPGPGLGLAGVRAVANTPGVETEFDVLLPLAGQAAQVEGQAPKLRSAQRRDGVPSARAILMIEDEESLRLAVCKMLRKSGLTVLEAGDG